MLSRKLYRGQLSLVAVTFLPDSAFDSGREIRGFDARFWWRIKIAFGEAKHQPQFKTNIELLQHSRFSQPFYATGANHQDRAAAQSTPVQDLW
jgi:hypothetical protein